MAGMQGPLRVRTFSSAACVHAVESLDGGSNPPHRSRSAMRNGNAVSSKEVKKTVKKLVSPLKQKWRIPQASRRSRSKAANGEAAAGAGDESDDAETFVSANNSELRSFRTDDDDDSEFPSFGLSSPLIFPVGVLECRRPAASPVKIVQKLPFGYVIGREQLVTPAATPPPPSSTLRRRFKKMIPRMMADLPPLRSRSRMISKKVVRVLKERFGRGRDDGRAGELADERGHDDGAGAGGHGDDQDVFWKKDLRGLRCRRVEDDEPPY